MSIIIKSPREIEIMRQAGRIVGTVLQELKNSIQPGVTTKELDDIAMKRTEEMGAIPSFKGYHGFPGSICASINDEIVHGIPGKRIVRDGDIISIDFGVIYNGFQGDAALTVGVGTISSEAEELMKVTEGSLMAGIDAARVGNRLGDISAAVQQYAESRGMAVVREYTGHGIGRAMHEDPQIPNYGLPGQGPLLKNGMTIAIEPMLNIGDWRTKVEEDNWTVKTMDGSLSAHFEHTIAITDKGPEIMTIA